MARCTATPPCNYKTNGEVHDAGCPARANYYPGELGSLYATETPTERATIGAVLEVLIDRHADVLGETPEDYDGNDVSGGEMEWLALRSAVRAGQLVGQVADLFTLRHDDNGPALYLTTGAGQVSA